MASEPLLSTLIRNVEIKRPGTAFSDINLRAEKQKEASAQCFNSKINDRKARLCALGCAPVRIVVYPEWCMCTMVGIPLGEREAPLRIRTLSPKGNPY